MGARAAGLGLLVGYPGCRAVFLVTAAPVLPA
jgi:hypothetical protein